jgi:hypothetical protein
MQAEALNPYLGSGVTVTRKKDKQSAVPFRPVATLGAAWASISDVHMSTQ